MPRLIDVRDERVSSLEECVDSLSATGFDPACDESLHHAALQLRMLGNDRSFLGDLLVRQLAERHREDDDSNGYGPQVVMLAPPSGRDFFIRANIWPSQAEHMVRASGGASFVYGLPHDHNFDFLTLGYFGSGYWSDYYEFDYEAVAGWSGEPVDLHFTGRRQLGEGQIMHYRAHRDVHAQLPADELSVSLNIMHVSGASGWLDQYAFDVDQGCVSRILSHGASEAFLRIAVGLGGEEAFDLAERFALHHPSERMRLHAFGAMASIAPDAQARDRVWARAEASGSRLLAHEAMAARKAIADQALVA